MTNPRASPTTTPMPISMPACASKLTFLTARNRCRRTIARDDLLRVSDISIARTLTSPSTDLHSRQHLESTWTRRSSQFSLTKGCARSAWGLAVVGRDSMLDDLRETAMLSRRDRKETSGSAPSSLPDIPRINSVNLFRHAFPVSLTSPKVEGAFALSEMQNAIASPRPLKSCLARNIPLCYEAISQTCTRSHFTSLGPYRPSMTLRESDCSTLGQGTALLFLIDSQLHTRPKQENH